jgi:hypothetical protein
LSSSSGEIITDQAAPFTASRTSRACRIFDGRDRLRPDEQRAQRRHKFAALYPDDTRPSFGYCLPLAAPGMPELAVIRARLFERAATLGHSAGADPDLHLVIDATIMAA